MCKRSKKKQYFKYLHFQSDQTMVLKILDHEIILCFLTALLIFITLNTYYTTVFLKKI